jgi:predicted RND superfamily exporter protein
MAILNYQMSMVTNNIPIILLAIGSAYTIHVINKIRQVKEKNYRKAITVALSYIFIPVILASITTAVGFTSFVFEAYLTMIKDFGIFTAIGTFLSAILALFFAPALLYVISPHRIKKTDYMEALERSILSERFLVPLQNLLFKHPRYTLITWSVLILLSAVAIFSIERNVDIKDYFRKDNPARLAENIMNEKFGGSKPIFIVFKGDVLSPWLLNSMMETKKFIMKDEHVHTAQSVADLVADMNYVLGEGRQIPDEVEKIQQLWFFLDGNEYIQRFVTDELDEAILISKYASSDNKERQEFVNNLNRFIENESCEECEIQLTGMPFIDLKMNRSLLSSQLRSLTIAIVALIIIVGLILRSFMTGVYATAPIIAAIVVLFGIMGITGIPLNIATVLVASVALGIGIDYSIHVISHFRHSLSNGKNLREALEETILISGKAIVINVISVSAGFLVLIFSEMVPLQYFGILMAISMVGSGMAALTLLPVILVLANRNRLSDFDKPKLTE